MATEIEGTSGGCWLRIREPRELKGRSDLLAGKKCPHEWGHCTQECVRHEGQWPVWSGAVPCPNLENSGRLSADHTEWEKRLRQQSAARRAPPPSGDGLRNRLANRGERGIGVKHPRCRWRLNPREPRPELVRIGDDGLIPHLAVQFREHSGCSTGPIGSSNANRISSGCRPSWRVSWSGRTPNLCLRHSMTLFHLFPTAALLIR